MTERPGVVITGRGVLSPVACDWPAFAAALREERPAPAAPFPEERAGDPPLCHPLSNPELLDEAPVQEGEPLGRLASAAVRDALLEAGLCRGAGDYLDDVGLVMTTALGPSIAVEAYLERLREKGPRAARPAQFVDTLLSMPASRTGIALGLRGSAAVVGGSSALEIAFDWIRSDREHAVVAGGADYLSPKCLRYHRALAERSGATRALLSQAAAFVVIEDAEHAAARDARVLGALLGSGGASEPQGATVPWPSDRTGAAFGAAIREALDTACISPPEVAVVVLASGDDASEAGELTAIERVLGAHPEVLRPKRVLGESLGASESIALLAALAHCDRGVTVVVNAFQMGGAVASFVLRTGP